MRATRSAAELLVGSASAPDLHRRPPSAGRTSGGPNPGGARPPSAALGNATFGLRKAGLSFRGSGSSTDFRGLSRTKTALDCAGLTKHEFGHALGDIGLVWEDTIVTSVKGQALSKGIRPGWKIHMVDGYVVNSSEEIWGRFQEAKWQWRNCSVWFVTDMIAIRAEAAANRASKIQAETERLARLPFEGSHDTRHLDQLKEEFKFQGWVEGAEHRAVSIAQLRHLLGWSGKHCHRWRDPKSRQRLNIDTMNTHQLNHWLIKPATKEKDCAMYEMLSREKQVPTWFVVQWWGEKVSNILTSLEAHVSLRSGYAETTFWIGAFANRQYSLVEDLAEGFQTTSYYKAMAAANFHLFLYLDHKTDKSGPATPVTRLWCDIELAMCLDEPKTVLDIATIQHGKPIILTKGLTQEEEESEKRSAGSGYKAKETRERSFSLTTIDKALSVSVEKAEVDDPDSRDRLLTAICGSNNPQEYTKVDKRLRALFALTCWRRIMAPTGDESMKDIQLKITDALRYDTWRETLDLSLAFISGGTEKMALLMRAIPPGLREFSLNVSGMNLLDEHVVALASSLPGGLESLNLDLNGNSDISNVGIANFMNNVPPKMRSQCLELKSTGVSKDFLDKADTMDGIRHAIYEESQKGNLCTTYLLLPLKEGKGRMAYSMEKSKCY